MHGRSNIGGVIFLFTALIMLGQCSPYAGKGLLTFFFDGFPVADSTGQTVDARKGVVVDSSGQGTEFAIGEAPVAYIHYPYEERECASCHDQNSLGTLVESQPGLCYMCHEDLGTRYAYLHGPVAGGYCTSCHDPHRSDHEKLLRFTGDQLCFYCHKSESVYQNEMHQDLDDMLCQDCHNPHGGEDRFIFH